MIYRDWEICVPSELNDRAEALFKSDNYISLPLWPFVSMASLSHTYTRFKLSGISFYLVLVPSKDIHLPPLESQVFGRSRPHGLPYPSLAVLIQSFLEANDHVSLGDAIDGSDVSEERGVENLDLEGEIDIEWAKWKNKLILEYREDGLSGLCSTQHDEKRELWQFMVRHKGGEESSPDPMNYLLRAFDYMAPLPLGWGRVTLVRMNVHHLLRTIYS